MPNLQIFQGLWGNSRDVEMYIFYWWKLDGVSVLSLYETLDKTCVRGVGYRQRVFLIGGECLLFVLVRMCCICQGVQDRVGRHFRPRI